MEHKFFKVIRFSFLAVFVVGMFLPACAFAETKVGVVNVQKIMSESKAAVSIQTQLEKQRKSFQDEFSKYERALVEQEKDLVEARAESDPEDLAKKKQEYENKLLETRKLVQKRQHALEDAAGKSLAELRAEVLKIVGSIAEEEGYDLVITRQNVILAQKNMDITDEVMTRLNKSIKEITLKIESN